MHNTQKLLSANYIIKRAGIKDFLQGMVANNIPALAPAEDTKDQLKRFLTIVPLIGEPLYRSMAYGGKDGLKKIQRDMNYHDNNSYMQGIKDSIGPLVSSLGLATVPLGAIAGARFKGIPGALRGAGVGAAGALGAGAGLGVLGTTLGELLNSLTGKEDRTRLLKTINDNPVLTSLPLTGIIPGMSSAIASGISQDSKYNS